MLVITIIVMIILAASIILTLTHSDIIEKAEQAKNESDLSTIEDLISLTASEWIAKTPQEKKALGGWNSFVETKLESEGYQVNDGKIAVGETVYSVDADGKLNVVTGVITIEAKNDAEKDKIRVVGTGKTRELKLTVAEGKAATNIEWESSDKKKATVDQNGKVTGVAAGTVKIIATANVDGFTYKVEHEITVKEIITFKIESTNMDSLVSGTYEAYVDDTWESWLSDGEFVVQKNYNGSFVSVLDAFEIYEYNGNDIIGVQVMGNCDMCDWEDGAIVYINSDGDYINVSPDMKINSSIVESYVPSYR